MAEQPEIVQDAEIDGEPLEESSGSRLWMILVPIVLLTAAGGASLSYFMYGQVNRTAASFFSGDEEEEQEEADPTTYGTFHQLDNMIVNPAQTNGTRYLMVNLGLESAEPSVIEEIGTKEVVIRDIVIDVLSRRTVEDLSEIQGRDVLKDSLRLSINGVLANGEIDRLYFTQYVLQ